MVRELCAWYLLIRGARHTYLLEFIVTFLILCLYKICSSTACFKGPMLLKPPIAATAQLMLPEKCVRQCNDVESN